MNAWRRRVALEVDTGVGEAVAGEAVAGEAAEAVGVAVGISIRVPMGIGVGAAVGTEVARRIFFGGGGGQ